VPLRVRTRIVPELISLASVMSVVYVEPCFSSANWRPPEVPVTQ
jgi:hypothetical protein